MKYCNLVLLCLIFFSSSCHEVKNDVLNFSNNDVLIYEVKYNEDYISEIELIVKLDVRAKGACKIEDFNSICLSFGEFVTVNEYKTKGQQCFIPSKNILISNQNRVELLEIKYQQDKYICLRMNILTLELRALDGFYVYFLLQDDNRQPVLKYNTEPFFYRSDKAKELKLFDDII